MTALALVGLAWIEGKIDSFGGGSLNIIWVFFFLGALRSANGREGDGPWVKLRAPPPWHPKRRETAKEERQRDSGRREKRKGSAIGPLTPSIRAKEKKRGGSDLVGRFLAQIVFFGPFFLFGPVCFLSHFNDMSQTIFDSFGPNYFSTIIV